MAAGSFPPNFPQLLLCQIRPSRESSPFRFSLACSFSVIILSRYREDNVIKFRREKVIFRDVSTTLCKFLGAKFCQKERSRVTRVLDSQNELTAPSNPSRTHFYSKLKTDVLQNGLICFFLHAAFGNSTRKYFESEDVEIQTRLVYGTHYGIECVFYSVRSGVELFL